MAFFKHGFNKCIIFFRPDFANGFVELLVGLAYSSIILCISLVVTSPIFFLPIVFLI